jgi:hypothetical protein
MADDLGKIDGRHSGIGKDIAHPFPTRLVAKQGEKRRGIQHHIRRSRSAARLRSARNGADWIAETPDDGSGLYLQAVRCGKPTPVFRLSNDKHFVEEVQDIVGLYLDPPDRALVFSVDEKSQIQALDPHSSACGSRKAIAAS